jgi:quinol monooxygenase YgiN
MTPAERKASDVSVVVVVTACPVPGHRAGVVAALEAAIARVRDEPGVGLYALPEGRDRLVMMEKYQPERARSEHGTGAALAGLRAALAGRLSSGLDVQVLVPHRAGDPHKGAL